MVSYRQTTYNQLETPSGAVGEAPDGPGAFQHVTDQVDGRLGIGGAEYCANSAAVTAIPSARRFVGKLAYRADQDMVFRYVGNGNTALGSADTTHPWQAFSKPPTPYTPTFTNLAGTNSVTALWGISDGIAWAAMEVVSGSGYSITGGSDVTATIPATILAALTNGRGTYYRGGLTTNGSQWDLIAYAPGPVTTAGSFRIRAIVQTGSASGAATAQNMLGNVVPSPYTSDRFQLEVRSPCAIVL